MGALKRAVIEAAERARLGLAEKARALKVRDARIREHLRAIKGAEDQRDYMGDAWADGVIAHRKRELRKLGVET